MDGYSSGSTQCVDGDCPVEPAPVDLRNLRRQFGLSQGAVADMIGVNQATISRWESGIERPSVDKQNALIDVLTNRKGRIDPIVSQLIRNHPLVSVFDSDLRFLHLSNDFANLLQINTPELIGETYGDVAEDNWFNEIYGDIPLSERVLVEFEHVLLGKDELEKTVDHNIHVRDFWIELEGQPGTLVALVDIVPASSTEPKLVQMIDTSTFRSGSWT